MGKTWCRRSENNKELLTTEAEKVEWPEDAEPKFIRKKATRATKVAYNTKMKQEVQGLYAELFSFFCVF